MIKFFRNIRQNLINEGKTTKYLKYAIGEIVLVVIGILIALQINNWNQNRLDAIERRAILKNMNLEFKANKNQILHDIGINNNTLNSGKILQGLIGATKSTLESNNLDSLVFSVLSIGSKAFPENTITELIQTGRIKYIQNDSIKNLIFDWTYNLESVVYYFDQSQYRNQLIVLYLNKKYPLKSAIVYSKTQGQEPSKLNIDKLSIFNDIEFENLLESYLITINVFLDRQYKLLDVIEQIIKATEPYDH